MASLLVGALPMASKSLSLSSILPFSRSQTFASVTLPTRSVCVSTSVTSPAPRLLITCGRGDKKTARGKRFNHSFGNARPRNKKKGRGPPRVHAPPIPPRRDPYDDGEKVKIEFDDESMFSRRKSKVKKAATKRSLQCW